MTRRVDLPIMPTTPLWPRMKPKRRNIRMLKTFSVTGTKTPAKVPSLSVPPTGLGNAPGLGLAVSLAERCLPFSALGRAMSKMLQNQLLMNSTPCSSVWTLELCSPPSGSSGVSSFGGDEMCTEERRCSRSAASVAVRAAKLERALGRTGREGCPGLASAMVQVVLQQQLGMCMVCPADKTRRWCAYRWGSGQSLYLASSGAGPRMSVPHVRVW
jgi:hypothetical protein